jgi:uncharacterized protein (TIGR00369 family)
MDEPVLRQIMEELIPFNRLLGLKLVSAESGHVRVRIPFREELVGDVWRPALHGGVISTLVDVTGGATVFTIMAAGDRVSTVDLRVDYLRPARKDDLLCEGRLLRSGNRVAVTQMSVTQPGSDDVVADGRAVYNIRRSPGERGET